MYAVCIYLNRWLKYPIDFYYKVHHLYIAFSTAFLFTLPWTIYPLLIWVRGGEEFASPHKQYSVDTLDIIKSEVSGQRIESKNCSMYL